jgi:hypothetical protein
MYGDTHPVILFLWKTLYGLGKEELKKMPSIKIKMTSINKTIVKGYEKHV